MSNSNFWIRGVDGKLCRFFPTHTPIGQIGTLVGKLDYRLTGELKEITLDQIVMCNTEGAWLLTRAGLKIPDSTKVVGTGYGADIKLEHYEDKSKKP